MSFSHYSPVTVDHTKVPSTQTDFPVLISVTDVRLKTVANSGHVQNGSGYDIRPYSNSGLTTALTYELERYNASTGELLMWVKIASLSSSVDTVIYLGYGDSGLSTDGSSTSTWSNNFLGVYHLGDGTTLNVNSATGSNNGTNTNGVTAAAGQIDGCGSFARASTQYISLGTGISPNEITYSAWVKGTSFPSTYNDVIVRNNVGGTIYTGIWVKSNGKLSPAFLQTGGTYRGYDGTGAFTLSTGTWYYVVATYAVASGVIGYVNASVDATVGVGAILDTTAIDTRIGGEQQTTTQAWNGQLDEVHIATGARSANWITTEFNNQNAPGSFLTLGTEVPLTTTVSVNLTGVAATPLVGVFTFNGNFSVAGVAASPAIGTGTVTTDTPATVSVTLTGVTATPAIGIGHVAIEGEVIAPPEQGLVAGGGRWYGLPEDEKVYLTGVAANPQVGKIAAKPRGTLDELYRMYPFPRQVEQRPLPVVRKKAAKPPKPVAFVYMAGVHPTPKIGSVTTKAFYEDNDEELTSMLKMMDVDEDLITALKLSK